jgi:hypothetical protein
VQATGKLQLPLDQDVQHYGLNAFSFVLQNPSKNPNAVTVSLEASLTSYFPSTSSTMTAAVQLVKSNGKAPAAIYKHDDAKYTSAQEASPLVIRNLEFELMLIRQVTISCLLTPCSVPIYSAR